MQFVMSTYPYFAQKQQGCIWQLLTVRWKATKTLTYCILHWWLNTLKLGGGWYTRIYMVEERGHPLSPRCLV